MNPFFTDVESTFCRNFPCSRQMTVEEVEIKPLWFRAVARFSYVTAPVQ